MLEQTQTYEYDQYARLTATALGNTRSTFTYDDLGQLKGIETIDGTQKLKIDLEYDDFGREVLRTFDLGGGVIQTLAQTYDEVDRLTQRTLMQGTETLRDETYVYDSRGRLVDYSCTGSQRPEDPYGKVIKGQLFGFDAQDNLDFVETTFEGGRNSSYYHYTNEADPCQLTAITNTFQPDYPQRIDFTYDADGNLLQDEAGRLLGYDSLGRLISVSALSGETANDYHYDSLDTLNGRSTSGGNERRFYQNGELANQLQGSTSSTFVRADGIVLAEHQAGADPKSLLLVSDDKNSVLCEISQDALQDIAYSPYGHRADDASVSSHLGYNGELREAQTGWYLLGNGYRAFNPLLMRFHSPDSWSPFGEGGVNTYTYCLGNPIGHTDPTGHSVWGSLRRLFVLTTKSADAEKVPYMFKISGKGKNSATLYKMKQADVDGLLNRVDFEHTRIAKDGASFNDVLDERLSRYRNAVLDWEFAKDNVGRKVITRHSSDMLKGFPKLTKETQPKALATAQNFSQHNKSQTALNKEIRRIEEQAAANLREQKQRDYDDYLNTFYSKHGGKSYSVKQEWL